MNVLRRPLGSAVIDLEQLVDNIAPARNLAAAQRNALRGRADALKGEAAER